MISVETKSFLAFHKAQVSRAGSHEATCSLILEDPGSRDNFIIHAFAEELEVPSEPVAASIKMPGEGHKAYQARKYQFQIKDMTKRNHTFNAIGMDKIASIDKAPQAQKLSHWFPGVSTIARQAFTMPYGAVKVLLGMPTRSVHSKDGREAGSLRLNNSVFHPEWVFTGCALTSHPGKEDTSNEATDAEASRSS